jgi:hypothetical protein
VITYAKRNPLMRQGRAYLPEVFTFALVLAGRDVAEGTARAVCDAKREAEAVALKLG